MISYRPMDNMKPNNCAVFTLSVNPFNIYFYLQASGQTICCKPTLYKHNVAKMSSS